MILEMYSVLDKAVGTFLPPVFVRARGEMLRSFMDAVNDDKHQFSRHLDDYYLYYLGRFDDVGGRFDVVDPERVASARECRMSVDQSPFPDRPGNGALDPRSQLG